jgi:putative addiction module killer protein
MNELVLSDGFREWLFALRDQRARARILARIRLAELGNFGDFAPVGEGVSEMRIHLGQGYRLYYARKDGTVYLLLAGGDKSTQKRDIARVIAMWRAVREEGK